jgi:regulator of cell morphogenesis and NO signaling
MTTIAMEKTVGELVCERPGRSRIFEDFGIDYCCGGKKPLAEACAKKGVAIDVVVDKLARADADASQEDSVDYSAMALDKLVDHIMATHHTYLMKELPRLEKLSKKVEKAHADSDARLSALAQVVTALITELGSHMMKEEQVLFPIIRELVNADRLPAMHCGALSNPIGVMEAEHDAAGDALATMRNLTDGYALPEGACNSYRALLDGLHTLELDLHQHIHKENNILFPRALALEAELPR